MGAAATVAKEDDVTATKSQEQNKTKATAMVICSACKATLGIFKRKKCSGCLQLHCARCLTARSLCYGGQPACVKCLSLAMGDYTADYLARQFTVRELRQFLSRKRVATDGCTEKHDLIALVMQLRRSSTTRAEEEEHSRHVSQLRENLSRELLTGATSGADRISSDAADEQPASMRQNSGSEAERAAAAETSASAPDSAAVPDTGADDTRDSTAEMSASVDDAAGDAVMQTSKDVARPRVGLADISCRGDIEELTVRQLKDLLVNNYVDYKGCCEKQELVDRVHELWTDHKKLIENMDSDVNSAKDSDLCKVCMDAAVNCILLECGHMVTCTNCGKRLAECPICRRYVSRVVHVFRA